MPIAADAGIVDRHLTVAIGVFALLAALLAQPAAAQERPRSAIDITVGWVGFADDGIVSESLIGGAARWYLFPRISVGPEVVFLHGENHSHLMVTANVTGDLLGPTQGRPRQLTPFVVAGVGLFQTREMFFAGSFTSTEGAFTAGGGVRAQVDDRVTVGIDARVGWELHLRVSGLVGLQFTR